MSKSNSFIKWLIIIIIAIAVAVSFMKLFPGRISSLCPGDPEESAVDGWVTCPNAANFWDFIGNSFNFR